MVRPIFGDERILATLATMRVDGELVIRRSLDPPNDVQFDIADGTGPAFYTKQPASQYLAQKRPRRVRSGRRHGRTSDELACNQASYQSTNDHEITTGCSYDCIESTTSLVCRSTPAARTFNSACLGIRQCLTMSLCFINDNMVHTSFTVPSLTATFLVR